MQHKSYRGLSINDVRRRNRRRFILIWFKIIVFFIVCFVVSIHGWNIIIKPKIVEQNLTNFPIAVASDAAVCLEKFKNNFCLLNKQGLNFYEKDGNKLKSKDYCFENPAIHCCNNYILSFDRGGKFCCVNSLEKEMCNLTLDDNILSAKIAENGNFAVVTKSDSFFCVLTIFNIKGQQIFKWSSVENLIVDFDFLKDGSGCFVTTIGVEKDGIEKAALHSFKFSQDREISKKIISETAPVALKVIGSRLVLVCIDKIIILDHNCGIIKSLQFVDDWNCFNLGNSHFVFAFNNKLVIYDKLVNIFNQCELNEDIKKIKINNNRIYALVDGKLYILNLNLKILKIVELNKLADDFFCEGKYGYFLFGNRLEKFKIF